MTYDRDTIWHSQYSRHNAIKDLDDTHIANIINYWPSGRRGRDQKLLKVFVEEAKLRNLSDRFLERAQIPHKDPQGQWRIWDPKERYSIVVGG